MALVHYHVKFAHEEDVFVMSEVSHQGPILRLTEPNAHRVSICLQLVAALQPLYKETQHHVHCVDVKVGVDHHCNEVVLMVKCERSQEAFPVFQDWDEQQSKHHHVEGVEDKNSWYMLQLPVAKLVRQYGQNLFLMALVVLKELL